MHRSARSSRMGCRLSAPGLAWPVGSRHAARWRVRCRPPRPASTLRPAAASCACCSGGRGARKRHRDAQGQHQSQPQHPARVVQARFPSRPNHGCQHHPAVNPGACATSQPEQYRSSQHRNTGQHVLLRAFKKGRASRPRLPAPVPAAAARTQTPAAFSAGFPLPRPKCQPS